MFASIQKLAKLLSLFKKSDEEFDKLTFSNTEFVKCEIWLFHYSYELSIYGTNFDKQDKALDEFSTLKMAVCMIWIYFAL